MDNVVEFPSKEDDTFSVEDILEYAKGEGLQSVIVIGELGDDKNYFNTNIKDARVLLWLLERMKHFLIESR